MTEQIVSRRVRLFKNGRNQAIRIPREFELPGDEAMLHKDADGRLIIEATRPKKLAALLSSWEPLSDDEVWPEIEDLPPAPVIF